MTSSRTSFRRALPIAALGLCLAPAAVVAQGAGAAWTPADAPLMTRWGRAVTPDNVWPEYPRPQMVREEWLNLNGLWEYAITDGAAAEPDEFDGSILVPFAVESALSGVGKRVLPDQRLWYRRGVRVPAAWGDQRVLLHFGAVDWDASVWVNGIPAASHRGGYDPFSVDITAFVRPGEAQEITVAVRDPSSTGDQARGKQKLQPQGIWYTPTTGIWQTVWLEPVPREMAIGELRVTPDLDRGVVEVAVLGREPVNSDAYAVRVTALDQGRPVAESVNRIDRLHTLAIPDAKLWSPDSPFLYDLRAELFRIDDPVSLPPAGEGPRRIVRRGAQEQARFSIPAQAPLLDRVDSYFGMRKISVATAADGHPQLMLNGRPLFQYGTLDQGYWPDGVLTPPSDEAMRYDLEFLKEAGFNMLRKHIKVEPARYYYWTDRLGLLVWQDMPSGMMMGDERFKDRSTIQHVMAEDEGEMLRRQESAAQFELELQRMMDGLHHFPSIVTWVVFNEGWGQYDTRRISAAAEARDPSRLVNAASGWRDVPAGHFIAQHSYDVDIWDRTRDGRRNLLPDPQKRRVAVMDEFGGLGYPVQGHLWQPDGNWGYQTYQDPDELLRQYRIRLDQISEGRTTHAIRAAVYTQTTDVEGEVNGLLTYDREVVKLDPTVLKELHAPLYGPASSGTD
jgi:beta-galactosidase/beta-glucuronidase